MTGDTPPAEKTTAELLGTLSGQVTVLVHQEMELAKAELTEKTKRIGVGAGIFGVAGVTATLAAGTLIAAGIAAISTVLSVWLSILIVGGFLAVIAGMLALMGITQISRGGPPVPEEALESTKEDVKWLKTQTKSAKP